MPLEMLMGDEAIALGAARSGIPAAFAGEGRAAAGANLAAFALGRAASA